MREVELKSVVGDPGAAIAALRAANAVMVMEGRLSDTRYDTSDRALLARDHVLRLREFIGRPEPATSIDWKGPTEYADGYKVREEFSSTVGDAVALASILAGLDYVVIREIHRDIWQYRLKGAVVRVERYPRMDALIEVEGEPPAIEAAIAALKLPRAGFTAERLTDFVVRFEARTGERAALSIREFAGDYRFGPNA
jgi:adenylate cyclase class IV